MRINTTVSRTFATSLLCAGLSFGVAAQDKAPVKIGAVTSLSGVFSQQGEEVLRGIEFAVEQANADGGIDGRAVEIQVSDDESTPEAGRRVAEKLARDGYNLLIGPISSSISMTLSKSLDRWDALFFGTLSKADMLTGEACSPRMFRTNHSDSMDLAMMREWLPEVEEEKFGIIAADYTWGQDSAEFFEKTADQLGKSVEVSLFPPLGTTDFAPYIAQLNAADIDALWIALVGRDAIAFAQQAENYGLTDKRFIGHAFIFNYLVEATGDAMQGVWGNIGYGPEIDTELNNEFVSSWQEEFGRLPTENEGQAYNGMQVIFEGVRKSDSVEPEAIAEALEGATLETVYGPATMRAEDHQLVIPSFIGQVKEVDGSLRPVIEERFPVSIYDGANASCEL